MAWCVTKRRVNFTFALPSSLWFLHYFPLFSSLFPSLFLYSRSCVRSDCQFSSLLSRFCSFLPYLFSSFFLVLILPLQPLSQGISNRERAVRTERLTPVPGCVNSYCVVFVIHISEGLTSHVQIFAPSSYVYNMCTVLTFHIQGVSRL
jgi:hypothetical protein